MNIRFRKAELSDLDYLVSLRNDTMNEHLINSGLSNDIQSHLDRIMYCFGDAQIIYLGNETIGMLKYSVDDFCYNIIQLQIADVYQGKGIGSQIIKFILREANKNRKKVTLSVLKQNPARYLYFKLGFVVEKENDNSYILTYNQKSII